MTYRQYIEQLRKTVISKLTDYFKAEEELAMQTIEVGPTGNVDEYQKEVKRTEAEWKEAVNEHNKVLSFLVKSGTNWDSEITTSQL